MYYLTYNSRHNNDGAGAQLQKILSLFLIAKKFGMGYTHSPFFTSEHNFNKQLLDRFNHLIELFGYNKKIFDRVIGIGHLTPEILDHLKNNQPDTDVLLIVPAANQYIDNTPSILHDLFPVKFSWVSDTLNTQTQIAFHIRRGDVSQTQNQDRFVALSYYLDCIKSLKMILTRSYTIHLFSEGSITKELENVDENFVLHIDDDVVDSFKFLVNCDLLFAGHSSFSYSASMLRRKGIVLYSPFWHSYPEKYLCVRDPLDIITYKDLILERIYK